MTFDQACHAARCGGRVRRADWEYERFLRFEDRLIDEMGNPYLPRPADTVIDNWELLQ